MPCTRSQNQDVNCGFDFADQPGMKERCNVVYKDYLKLATEVLAKHNAGLPITGTSSQHMVKSMAATLQEPVAATYQRLWTLMIWNSCVCCIANNFLHILLEAESAKKGDGSYEKTFTNALDKRMDRYMRMNEMIPTKPKKGELDTFTTFITTFPVKMGVKTTVRTKHRVLTKSAGIKSKVAALDKYKEDFMTHIQSGGAVELCDLCGYIHIGDVVCDTVDRCFTCNEVILD